MDTLRLLMGRLGSIAAASRTGKTDEFGRVSNYDSYGKGGVDAAAAFGRGSGAVEERAGHAADACRDLPAGLERSRVHDAARIARGQAAARTLETGNDPGRTRHPFDGDPVRRRTPAGTRRRGLGGQERDAEEEPRGKQQILRGGAQIRSPLLAAVGRVILPRICRGDRRRPRRDGGGKSRRRRCRRAVDRPQHRAAARAGAEHLCDPGAVLQLPLFRHPQDAFRHARQGRGGVSRRLARWTILRDTDPDPDRDAWSGCR